MWITTVRQHISSEEIMKSFKKCSISNVVDGTEDKLWNGSEEDGMLAVSVRKMKAPTVKMEAATLTGKVNVTRFKY